MIEDDYKKLTVALNQVSKEINNFCSLVEDLKKCDSPLSAFVASRATCSATGLESAIGAAWRYIDQLDPFPRDAK